MGAFITEARTWLAHPGASAPEAVKQIGYFENNQSRMLYGTYRAKGCFIGSGVVEAGCKTVIGQRVKQSGMLWSVNGAGHVLDVRCAVLNRDFEVLLAATPQPSRPIKKGRLKINAMSTAGYFFVLHPSQPAVTLRIKGLLA